MASAVATPLQRQFRRVAGSHRVTSIRSGLGSTVNHATQFDLDREHHDAAGDTPELPLKKVWLPRRPSSRASRCIMYGLMTKIDRAGAT